MCLQERCLPPQASPGSQSSAWAQDDAYMQEAKAYIEKKVTAPVTTWDGPTSGPKAQEGRPRIYASADQKNGGASGVGDGAQEAAEVWAGISASSTGRIAPARTSAPTQAIALNPDGIILGTIDAAEAPIIEQAIAAGIKVVGWHAGGAPGKIDAVPGVFTNITTDPNEVAKVSALTPWSTPGARRRDPVHRLAYAIATAKTDAEKRRRRGARCKVLEIVDTPIGELGTRMGQSTTSLLAKYGDAWTYSIGVNDLTTSRCPRWSLPALTWRVIHARSRRRWFGAGVPAHSREAVSGRDRRRAAAPAWLADDRRTEPRLCRRA